MPVVIPKQNRAASSPPNYVQHTPVDVPPNANRKVSKTLLITADLDPADLADTGFQVVMELMGAYVANPTVPGDYIVLNSDIGPKTGRDGTRYPPLISYATTNVLPLKMYVRFVQNKPARVGVSAEVV